MDVLAFVPLLAQAIYTGAAFPRFTALVRAKRSDQHSVAYHALIVLAHAILMTWAYFYAHEVGLTVSTFLGMITSGSPIVIILYYRKYPGGRHAKEATKNGVHGSNV